MREFFKPLKCHLSYTKQGKSPTDFRPTWNGFESHALTYLLPTGLIGL